MKCVSAAIVNDISGNFMRSSLCWWEMHARALWKLKWLWISNESTSKFSQFFTSNRLLTFVRVTDINFPLLKIRQREKVITRCELQLFAWVMRHKLKIQNFHSKIHRSSTCLVSSFFFAQTEFFSEIYSETFSGRQRMGKRRHTTYKQQNIIFLSRDASFFTQHHVVVVVKTRDLF